MAEPVLWGIGISTWASIGVTIGTIILAIFTYLSVKVSEKQMELTRKMIEKPRILEKIHSHLNIIEDELQGEIDEIERNNIKWTRNSDRNNLFLSPIIFPLSQKKPFYKGIQYLFIGPEKGNSEIYSNVIQPININLRARYRLYQSTNAELIKLEKIILNDNFHERITNLFMKLPEYSLIQDFLDAEDIFVTYFDGTNTNKITKPDLYNIIVGMMISLIFDPMKPDNEISGFLGYHKVIQDLHSHIIRTLKDQPIQEIDRIINCILGDLNEIKLIDEDILSEIKSLKEFYRKEYILTEDELNPFSGI
jgi:hypothetical protein